MSLLLLWIFFQATRIIQGTLTKSSWRTVLLSQAFLDNPTSKLDTVDTVTFRSEWACQDYCLQHNQLHLDNGKNLAMTNTYNGVCGGV